MGCKKNKKALCIMLIIFCIAVCILFVNTKIESRAVIGKNNKTSFCSVKFFKNKYLVSCRNSNLLTLKLLSSGNCLNIYRFSTAKDVFLICSNDNMIKLFSEDAKLVSSYKANDEQIKSICTGDLNSDGTDEVIMITGREKGQFGEKVSVISFNNGFKQLYEKSIKDLKPWKVQVCDIDGDGKLDISIGVYKKTEFHPVMAKRPFIYNWENGFISPKWLGSRLSQPFDDYVFCDADNDGFDEIISIENTKDNKKVLAVYKWKGFGVEQVAATDKYDDISEIVVVRNEKSKNVIARIHGNSRWGWYTLEYSGQKIFLRKGNGLLNQNVY